MYTWHLNVCYIPFVREDDSKVKKYSKLSLCEKFSLVGLQRVTVFYHHTVPKRVITLSDILGDPCL